MWSNFQGGHACIMKHLDRAMLFDHTHFFFHMKHASIPIIETIPDTTTSNHAPIMFTILRKDPLQHHFKYQFFMNTSFLHHPTMVCHICRILNLVPHPPGDSSWIAWWNDAITHTNTLLHSLGKIFAQL